MKKQSTKKQERKINLGKIDIYHFPITLDTSAWYMGTSTAVLFALGAIALWAFTNAITRSSRIQDQA